MSMQVAFVAKSDLEKARSLALTVPALAKPVLSPAVVHFSSFLHSMSIVP